MSINEEISQTMEQVLAKIYHKDEEYLASHHELRFKEDLMANSKHYFPIIAAFEDKYDLFMDYHLFQYAATTIESAIEYVIEEYHKQKA